MSDFKIGEKVYVKLACWGQYLAEIKNISKDRKYLHVKVEYGSRLRMVSVDDCEKIKRIVSE